jgi:hypothetical protein
MKFMEFVLIILTMTATVFGAAVVAQMISDKWHNHSIRREFGRIAEKEQRRYRR